MTLSPRSLCALLVAAIAASASADTLTAGSALDSALAHSPQMVQAKLALDQGRQQLRATRASLMTRATLQLTPIDYSNQLAFNNLLNTWNTSRSTQSYGMLQISQPVTWTDATVSLSDRFGWQQTYSDSRLANQSRGSFYSQSLTLSLTQPLFTYNRSALQLRQQELSNESGELAYAIKKLAMELSVAEAFYSLYKSQMAVRIAQEALDGQHKSLVIMEAKVAAGLAAKQELYQARINETTTGMDLDNKKVQCLNSADALKKLIGASLEADVTAYVDAAPAEIAVDSAKALSRALQARMEFRACAIAIENAKADLVRAKATNWFQGSITASYGLVGKDSVWSEAVTRPAQNQQAAISLQIPLWDWGERKARMSVSSMGIRAAEVSLDQEKADITTAVVALCRSIRMLQGQIAAARQSVDYAQLTYDLNLERYSRGDLSSLDLFQYQSQLSSRKTDLTNILVDYRTALLNLKVQSLWDFERNEPVVPMLGQ